MRFVLRLTDSVCVAEAVVAVSGNSGERSRAEALRLREDAGRELVAGLLTACGSMAIGCELGEPETSACSLAAERVTLDVMRIYSVGLRDFRDGRPGPGGGYGERWRTE